MTHRSLLGAFGVAAAVCLGACSDPSMPQESAVATGELRAPDISECRPAPPDSEIPLPIADPSRRVDLATPTFTHPTHVVNPLFPIRELSQAILLGAVDGEPLRIETTLMPRTLQVDMGDHEVETLASSFLAIVDRRIHEYALDRYAQADDGSVWYFGEDVFNYENGEVADTEGTWLACQDGPAAMIMAAHPRVGDVWRTENLFGLVFEEITVQHVGQTVDGPRGPVTGAITVQELHMDGSLEAKVFAPGRGEFTSGVFPNFEALALAVPADALPGHAPAELRTLLAGARRVFHAVRSRDWIRASTTVSAMSGAWARYPAGGVPRLLQPMMAEALDDLTQAVSDRATASSRQAAVDVGRNGLDLLLQYRPRIDVDLARVDLWASQLVIDVEARDTAGIASDVAILKWILERLAHAGDRRDREDVGRARKDFVAIRGAVRRGDLAAVLRGAHRLQEGLRERVHGDEEGDAEEEGD